MRSTASQAMETPTLGRVEVDGLTVNEENRSMLLTTTIQGGCVKKLFFAMSLIAVLVWSTAIPLTHAKDSQAPAPLSIEQMRAVAYTKGFAKRFALPEPEADTEPSGGIQAMEFSVEEAPKDAKLPLYSCKLYLYLDNKLSVSYPEAAVGAHYLPSRATYLLSPNNERWDKWSVEDRKFLNERKTRYTNHVWLATPDYPGYFDERSKKPFAATSMFYDEYHRDLFPGLAYLKIDMGCPAYSWIDKVEAIQIWIKREGAKDYSRELRKDPADFLKFSMPMPFYKKIINPIKAASDYNSKMLNGNIRQNREKRMRESERYLKEMFKESKQAK